MVSLILDKDLHSTSGQVATSNGYLQVLDGTYSTVEYSSPDFLDVLLGESRLPVSTLSTDFLMRYLGMENFLDSMNTRRVNLPQVSFKPVGGKLSTTQKDFETSMSEFNQIDPGLLESSLESRLVNLSVEIRDLFDLVGVIDKGYRCMELINSESIPDIFNTDLIQFVDEEVDSLEVTIVYSCNNGSGNPIMKSITEFMSFKDGYLEFDFFDVVMESRRLFIAPKNEHLFEYFFHSIKHHIMHERDYSAFELELESLRFDQPDQPSSNNSSNQNTISGQLGAINQFNTL